MPWRREWQATPVFFPGEPHGQRSLVGYSPWGLKGSDTSKQLNKNSIVFIYLFFDFFIDYAKAFDCVDHNKLWKILKEMGIPGYLTCLLINLYAVRNQQLELDMEQQTGCK